MTVETTGASRAERNAALVEVMLLAAMADGQLTEPAVQELLRRILERPEFDGTHPQELSNLVEKGVSTLAAAPNLEQILQQLRERLPTHQNRVLAFGLAASVALADQRANHHVPPVVRAEDGGHRLQSPGEEEVEEQRLRRVVAMVPEGDLVAAQLHRRVVEDAPAEPGAHRTLGLPRRGLLQDDGVGVLAQHPERHRLAGEVIRQQMSGKSRMALVERHRQQLEPDRGSPLQQAEQVKQRVGVLPSRHPHQDAVSLGDEAEVGDGPAHVAEQALLDL